LVYVGITVDNINDTLIEKHKTRKIKVFATIICSPIKILGYFPGDKLDMENFTKYLEIYSKNKYSKKIYMCGNSTKINHCNQSDNENKIIEYFNK
jgi:hypothetical protein